MPLKSTLTEFIIGEQRKYSHATGGFTALLNDIRLACKRIAYLIGKGALGGAHGAAAADNVQGERQMKLDVLANDIFLRTNEWGGHLAGDGFRGAGGGVSDSGAVSRAAATCSSSIRWTGRPTSTSMYRSARIFSILRRAPSGDARDGERFPAAGRKPGLCRLCDLRPVHHAGPYARHRGARLHAGTRARRVHSHPSGYAHSRRQPASSPSTPPTSRHWEPAGARAMSTNACRHERPARQGFQHALDRLAGRRGPSHPDARRRVPVSRATARTRATQRATAAALRGESDRLPRSSRRAARAARTRAHPRPRAGQPAPARAADLRLARGGRAHRALSRRAERRIADASPLFGTRGLFRS